MVEVRKNLLPGVVKVFDRRMEEEDAVVRKYSDHAAWVQNVRWHPKLSG